MALPTADRSARVGRLVKLANLCREKSSFKTAAAIIAGCKRQTLAQNQVWPLGKRGGGRGGLAGWASNVVV